MTLILRVMRGGAVAAAGFMVLVIGIEIWKRWRFGGFGSMGRHDVTFMVVLVLMLVGFLWLARSITRELHKDGRSRD
ncbi:MAG TPA: hypothetical protein P5337_09565 [Aestuariivirga sp.]|nr:hypothetical protein [Alphaproteobacteria bacterium]HRX36635.1 hypothetical protein [Aestuariivirga sp.]